MISADDRIETVRRGLTLGAPSYLLKPITTDQTRNLWQYSVLWKNREKYAYQRAIQANIPRSIPWSSAATYTADEPRGKKPLILYICIYLCMDMYYISIINDDELY